MGFDKTQTKKEPKEKSLSSFFELSHEDSNLDRQNQKL